MAFVSSSRFYLRPPKQFRRLGFRGSSSGYFTQNPKPGYLQLGLGGEATSDIPDDMPVFQAATPFKNWPFTLCLSLVFHRHCRVFWAPENRSTEVFSIALRVCCFMPGQCGLVGGVSSFPPCAARARPNTLVKLLRRVEEHQF